MYIKKDGISIFYCIYPILISDYDDTAMRLACNI